MNPSLFRRSIAASPHLAGVIAAALVLAAPLARADEGNSGADMSSPEGLRRAPEPRGQKKSGSSPACSSGRGSRWRCPLPPSGRR